MKTSELPADVTLYRAFMPRWAAEPLSGAGAALSGGRFNRHGVPALYLSLELATAVAEYQQAAPFLPPFTMVTYRAKLPPLVDVRLLDGQWDPLWNDWDEDWRTLLVNRIEPPSWVLGDLVRRAGLPGILFPSAAVAGGLNLVLFLGSLAVDGVLSIQEPAAGRAQLGAGRRMSRGAAWG